LIRKNHLLVSSSRFSVNISFSEIDTSPVDANASVVDLDTPRCGSDPTQRNSIFTDVEANLRTVDVAKTACDFDVTHVKVVAANGGFDLSQRQGNAQFDVFLLTSFKNFVILGNLNDKLTNPT
jgi:hypothetical protein